MIDSADDSDDSAPPASSGSSNAALARQAIRALLRDDPFLIIQLLRTLNVALPFGAVGRYVDPPYSTLGVPADVALELASPFGDLPILTVVVEVAIFWSVELRRTWAAHAGAAVERGRGKICVLVVTPNPQVAKRSARPLSLGPRSRFVPLVAGPAILPRSITTETAKFIPGLALLSAFTHAQDPIFGALVRRSALVGVDMMPPPTQGAYLDVLEGSLDEATRAKWEAEIDELARASPNKHAHASDFARAYVAEARRRARAEGDAAGRAHSLLVLLEARGISVPSETRDRVLACRSTISFELWIARAARATSVDEVFRE